MLRTQTARNVSHCTTACNSCRTRKIKCGGEPPLCAACAKHGRECDWPLDGDRRTALWRKTRNEQLESDNARLEGENVQLKAELALVKELLPAGASMAIQPAAVYYAPLLSNESARFGAASMPYFQYLTADGLAVNRAPPPAVAAANTTPFALAPHAVESFYTSTPAAESRALGNEAQIQEVSPSRAMPLLFTGYADQPRL
ncbi:hypothetical protein AURDEDRAFT_172476 [Auricularia subglabra TFB-10046 SS5]|nr:hypothetical protein AURDEDRAFT_172476 [Auricularia subglabra TFB-10046 SS5]